jgi:hypothetical protein
MDIRNTVQRNSKTIFLYVLLGHRTAEHVCLHCPSQPWLTNRCVQSYWQTGWLIEQFSRFMANLKGTNIFAFLCTAASTIVGMCRTVHCTGHSAYALPDCCLTLRQSSGRPVAPHSQSYQHDTQLSTGWLRAGQCESPLKPEGRDQLISHAVRPGDKAVISWTIYWRV